MVCALAPKGGPGAPSTTLPSPKLPPQATPRRATQLWVTQFELGGRGGCGAPAGIPNCRQLCEKLDAPVVFRHIQLKARGGGTLNPLLSPKLAPQATPRRATQNERCSHTTNRYTKPNRCTDMQKMWDCGPCYSFFGKFVILLDFFTMCKLVVRGNGSHDRKCLA